MLEAACSLVCNEEGIFIWPGVALVERRGAAFIRVSDQEICNRAASLHGPTVIGGTLIPTLDRAARFLECGQIAKAEACIAQLQLPPLSEQGETLMRRVVRDVSPVSQKTFDPEKHPRWPAGAPDSAGGEFRPGDGGSALGEPAPSQADRLSECIDKCYQLLERPLPSPGSDRNTWDFHRCVNACRGKYT